MKKVGIGIVILGLFSTSALAMEFTCQLENKKYVSVTVDHNQAPQYRYGTLAKPEISLPADGKGTQNVYVGQAQFAAGGSVYIRFQNGAYSYLLYEGSGRGWEFKGLAVYKGKKLINSKQCQDTNAFDLYDILNFNLPKDTDDDTLYAYDPQSNI